MKIFVPVIVESPYAGDIERNEQYAREALSDCIHRGEAPFASHLLYTQPGVLRDHDPEERQLGIAAGFTWHNYAAKMVVYSDLGISSGMRAGIENAERIGLAVVYRYLGGAWTLPTTNRTKPEQEKAAADD